MRWRIWLALAVVASGVGCLKVKEQLTVLADGSGTVTLETESEVPPEALSGLVMMLADDESGAAAQFPPLSKDAVVRLFPGESFQVDAKEVRDGAKSKLSATVAFKDINALMASPYGRAHSLVVMKGRDGLQFKALSGLQAVMQMAESKDAQQQFGMVPNMADLQKKSGQMYFEMQVTLPATVSSANGTKADKTVTWIVDRTKLTDSAAATKALSTVMEATCAADAIRFTPEPPVRLDLVSFKDLPAGAGGKTAPPPPPEKVSAAVKFIPYALQAARSIDLSGEGMNADERATLVGVIRMPQALAPQKWGAAKIEEAVDEQGNDLLPSDEEERHAQRTYFSQSMARMMGQEPEDPAKPPGTTEQIITFSFKSPDWKAKEIARLKGTVELQYLAASQVVKLENVIAPEMVADMAKAMSGNYEMGEQTKLANPQLQEAGLELTPSMTMQMNGMTMITMMMKGSKALITDAQVFDAEGKPWQTMLKVESNEMMGSCQIMVAGSPKAPLSLALLVSGVGMTVKVPLQVEHVPLHGTTKEVSK